MSSLTDKRVLVIGASAGIGRAVAAGVAAAGGRVAAAARRAGALAELDAVAIPGDVTVDADCARIVDDALTKLGGLDAVVYTVGASPLMPLAEATSADWHKVLATNVVGAAQIITRAAPHLLKTDGRVVVLSSKAVIEPFPDLSLYSTSKVALDGLLRCLPLEFPGLRVTRVVVGNTIGTDFANAWDADRLQAAVERWTASGVLGTGGLMHVDQVAEAVLFALSSTAYIPELAVIDHESDDGSAPSPPAGQS